MKTYWFAVISFLILFATGARADDDGKIYIKIGEASVKKSLIAVPPFQFLSSPAGAPNFKQTGVDLFNTVANDMEVSNLFQIIKQEAYLEDAAKTGLTPAPGNPNGFKFENWSKISADFLIKGGFKINGDQLEFEAYVYYVPQAKAVLTKKYIGSVKDPRLTAHTFADDLMQTLTGKRGIFKTKFVAASDRAGNTWREIYVMDWDGRNMVQVTSHKSVSLSPAWSPNGKTVSYTSFAWHPRLKLRNADLFTYDVFDGKRFLVSSRRGLNSGSTFSSDGKWIFLTLTAGQDPDLYRMDLDGESLTRLTSGPRGALNVEPAASPDGKKLAFSSDRHGRPHIYTMDVDGSGVKRITFAGMYNSSPAWSPDSKKLVFAGRDKGHFDIFTVNADGSEMKRLTSAKKTNGDWANNEDPSFSPDGRYVVFTSNRTGKSQIYMINTDGTNERRVTVDNHNYFKARWSPYM